MIPCFETCRAHTGRNVSEIDTRQIGDRHLNEQERDRHKIFDLSRLYVRLYRVYQKRKLLQKCFFFRRLQLRKMLGNY